MFVVFCCCDLVMSARVTVTCTTLIKCQEHDLSENVSHSVVTTAHCPPILPVSGYSTLYTLQTQHNTGIYLMLTFDI